MERKPINNKKRETRFGYISELNKHIKIIQEGRRHLYCYGFDKDNDEEIRFSLTKLYECGTGSGVLYCQPRTGDPIKFEYIDSIKVGNLNFGFAGKIKEYTDDDYSEFLSKRIKRIRSIDIYEKEESS